MGKIKTFIKECGIELKKVVWPTFDDVVASVKVVIISTILVAIILGVLDMVFTYGMRLVF
ncbi:MAG: preprotein translocase subunit SecE [Treponema sp.]|nr:preprotein translocase subunit SecE [Treponema sp.]